MIKSRTTWNAGIFVLTLLALVPLAPYVSPYLPSFMKAAIPGFVKEAYHSVAGRNPADDTSTIATEDDWKRLEERPWIADGSDHAPRVVYVFTDLNCPYCERFWIDARPWVDGGRVQLRHILVGIVTPTSPGKAAALRAQTNPALALSEYEGHQASNRGMTTPSIRPGLMLEGDLAPVAKVPADVQAELDANQTLMKGSGLRGTPSVIWRDRDHVVHMRAGVPEAQLPEILGPL
jgi:thiol:disulfide interchange protein DsbG